MSNINSTRMALNSRPEDGILVPPSHLISFYEQQGEDPRIPKKAIGRVASTHYRTAMDAKFNSSATGRPMSLGWADEAESYARPSHYPNHFGLSRIPRVDETPWSSWHLDHTRTICYTSLNIPRPFDPHVNGLDGSTSIGMGYMYRGGSSWMGRFDMIGRRGGGNRGGFAFTTGPTEGSYPTSIMPVPKINLGRLGYTNGGWNPEGMVYNQRPKQMRLTGLRNGWAHKVYFARSRKVMFRNVYGPIGEDEATPNAPTVLINGMRVAQGVISISSEATINSPTEIQVEINNPKGSRSGQYKEYDMIQIRCSPRRSAQPPIIFTGFISNVKERGTIRLTALDSLGYLGLEPLLSTPDYSHVDAAQVIREIAAGSNYPLTLGRMITQARVRLPVGINLSGKSRLAAIQTVLDYVNTGPRSLQILADEYGVIGMNVMMEPLDVLRPLIGGREELPLNGASNLSLTRDFWPRAISSESGTDRGFNVATVRNSNLGITQTFPIVGSTDYPSQPVHRLYEEQSATTDEQASFLARQFVTTQEQAERYYVKGRPERFDIAPGEVMTFFGFTGAGIAGNHRIYNVSWTWSTNLSEMSMVVGRQPASLISSLRFAIGSGQ